MRIDVVTLFPEMFTSLTEYGVAARAIRTGSIGLHFWNPRDYAIDQHGTVDDRSYGGGPGMVLKPEPVTAALRAAKDSDESGQAHVVYLSPQGKLLDHEHVEALSRMDRIVLLAGRYEGVDERVVASEVDEEISIGDYVLTGGELPCMVLIDAVSRLLPGTLGKVESAQQDSFAQGLLDHPHFTRPPRFAGQGVPEVLLTGDHARIRRWRLEQSLERTRQRRPDLLAKLQLSEEQNRILNS
jgi:tRNA (guanine37-N1)-methyltransferase